jgi:hypothetical protein
MKEKADVVRGWLRKPRYDDSFWPTLETAKQARTSALRVRDFVLARLPKEIVHPAK